MWKRYLVTNTIFVGLAVKETVRARLRALKRRCGVARRNAAGRP
jgi:hypothetical protein